MLIWSRTVGPNGSGGGGQSLTKALITDWRGASSNKLPSLLATEIREPVLVMGGAFPLKFGPIKKLLVVWPLYILTALTVVARSRRWSKIVFWQQAIGIAFAAACRFLRIRTTVDVFILMFILVPTKRRGWYRRVVAYAIEAPQVQRVACYNAVEMEVYRALFPAAAHKFVLLPFCEEIEDPEELDPRDDGFFLSVGRSNRDHGFLVNAFASLGRQLLILDDYVHPGPLPENVRVLRNVFGRSYLRYVAHCHALVFAFKDPVMSAGQLVFVHGAQLGKPSIVVRSSCLAGYAEDAVNSIFVEREGNTIAAAVDSLDDSSVWRVLSDGARRTHERRFSLRNLAASVGKLVLARRLEGACGGDDDSAATRS